MSGTTAEPPPKKRKDEEEEQEEEEEEDEQQQKHKDDDEEDEDDDEDEFEKDGFIVEDDAIDEEEDHEAVAEGAEKKKKRRHRRKKEHRLDEDDIDLIVENQPELAATLQQQKDEASAKPQFRRLKKGGDANGGAGASSTSSATAAMISNERSAATATSTTSTSSTSATAGTATATTHRNEQMGEGGESDLQEMLFGPEQQATKEQQEQQRQQQSQLHQQQQQQQQGMGGEDEEDGGFVVDEQDKAIKPSGRRNGASSSYPIDDDDQDGKAAAIFGDESEELNLEGNAEEEEDEAKRGMNDEGQEIDRIAQMEATYEPAELEKRFFTHVDLEIKNKDLPERYQIARGLHLSQDSGKAGILLPTATPAPATEREEAEWIYRTLEPNAVELDATKIDQITSLLEFYHRDQLEVPFISTYMPDYTYLFGNAEMWATLDQDILWQKMQLKKERLVSQLIPLVQFVPKDTVEMITEAIGNVRSEVDIQDISDHVLLFRGLKLNLEDQSQPIGDNNEQQGMPKAVSMQRAIKRDFYNDCRDAGLRELAEKIGLSARQFSINLNNLHTLHKPQDLETLPEEEAVKFVRKEFPNVGIALKGARHLLAKDIAYDPMIRAQFRAVYDAFTVVVTKPVASRNSEMDKRHPYYTVKRITETLTKFMEHPERWALVAQAEQEGFITVQLAIEPERLHTWVEKMKEMYFSTATNLYAEAWNQQRSLVLDEAIAELQSIMESQKRQRLLTDSSNWVMAQAAQELSKKIFVAPFVPRGADEEEKKNAGNIPIIGVSFSDSSSGAGANMPPTTVCVAIGEGGQLMDALKLDWIAMADPRRPMPGSTSSNAFSPEADTRKKHDVEKLERFIRKSHARAVVISASCPEARRVHQVATEFRDLDVSLTVTYGDPSLAKIYSRSERAQQEFPSLSLLHKEAVSIARALQDPLAEYCGLCTGGNPAELLCLDLHPSQNFVIKMRGKERFAEILQRKFIDLVNMVGVDINRVAKYRNTSAQLQFVAGLGPRKASALLDWIWSQGGTVTSREAIKQFLNPVVARNAIGFIRVHDRYLAGLSSDNNELEILDDTRVHPENYRFARKIAFDALIDSLPEDEKGSKKDEESTSNYVREFMGRGREHLQRIINEVIDIEGFATQLEKSGGGKQLRLLQMIAKEFPEPFSDPRPAWAELTPQSYMEMMLGCKLKQGDLFMFRITGKLLKSSEGYGMDTTRPPMVRGTICDGGLFATIEEPELGSHYEEFKENLVVGTHWEAYLMEVDAAHWEAHMTCREPEKTAEELLLEQADREAESLAAVESLTTAVPVKSVLRYSRAVKHPMFRNFTPEEVEEYLKNEPVGSALIRPSTRNEASLTLTWKLSDKVSVHINIEERKKANVLTIGKELLIGSEMFEDINELLARFLEPLNQLFAEAQTHKVYKSGSKAEIDAQLLKDREANPKRIAYYVSLSEEKPGRLLLSYIPRHTPHHELIAMSPQGFRFRNVPRPFQNLDRLIGWFKQHWQEKPPVVAPSTASDDWGSLAAAPAQPPAIETMNTTGEWGSATTTAATGGWAGTAAPLVAPSQGWGAQTSGWAGTAAPAASSSGWGNDTGGWSSTTAAAGDAPSEPSGASHFAGTGRSRACYKCGETGHISHDCPKAGGGAPGGGSNRACYRCGQEGHMSRDCPSGNAAGFAPRPKTCYNCGETGHISAQCPRKNAGYGGGTDQPISTTEWASTGWGQPSSQQPQASSWGDAATTAPASQWPAQQQENGWNSIAPAPQQGWGVSQQQQPPAASGWGTSAPQ